MADPDFPSGLPREAYALLAQANLLRMRGCWAEATENCMAALRLSPENASAQSLLGDIYENQGLLDDAIQWYRMALDVQPDSPADTLKLARLIDAKSRLLTPAPPPSVEKAPVPPAEPLPAPLLWLRRKVTADPERILRRASYAAGAVVVAVIAAALLLSRPAARSLHPISAPPLVLSSPVTPSNLSTAPSAAPAPAAPAVPRDPAEQLLLDSLRAAPQLAGTGVTVTDVEDDPRTGHLTLTLTCAPPSGVTLSRAFVMDCALRAMQSAAAQSDPQTVSLLTVRCLLSAPGSAETPLVFTADSARAALSAPGQSPTPAQAQALFANSWWSPSAPT